MSTIRVLLADDHPLVRGGLRAALAVAKDITLVGEAIDGYKTQQMCADCRPDVLLLDLQMPGPPAIETVTFLRTYMPTIKVLVLTAYNDDVYVRGMVTADVAGYILKDEADESVVEAIRTVMRNRKWYSQAVKEKLARWKGGPAQAAGTITLTERERTILQLLVEGQTNQRIASALGISEKTVEKYLGDLFTKLKLASRVEAAVWAVRAGIC
jgi:DNA-binding NarL/FixJ family response regulator